MKLLTNIINFSPYIEKQKLIKLIILILATTFFEIIGIGSIVPFVATISNPSLVESNTYLIYLYDLSLNFGVHDIKGFFIFLGAIAIIFLFISLSVRALTN